MQDYWQLARPVSTYLDAFMSFEPIADDPYLAYYEMNKHRVKRLRKTIRLEADNVNQLPALFRRLKESYLRRKTHLILKISAIGW